MWISFSLSFALFFFVVLFGIFFGGLGGWIVRCGSGRMYASASVGGFVCV